jgi:hypothetical protein
VSLFVLSPETEDRDEVEVANWAKYVTFLRNKILFHISDYNKAAVYTIIYVDNLDHYV